MSGQAFVRHLTSRKALQVLAYAELRSRGLSAQPALHVLRKVADAYATLKANVRAGNLGKPGSKRYAKVIGKPIAFREGAAQPYDDRCLSWRMSARLGLDLDRDRPDREEHCLHGPSRTA